MEVVSSITDRIQEIQGRLTRLSTPPTAPAAPAVLGVVERSTTFDAALAQQMSAYTAAGVAPTGNAAGLTTEWVLNPPRQMIPATSGLAGAARVGGVGSAWAAAGVDAVGSGKSRVNAKGVPVELLRFGNGKVPAEALSPIAGAEGHRLWAPAARSFEALRAAAARDGVKIGVTDSYRPYEVQVDLVRRKGLYSQGGLAAKPGTSNHGWGIALDLRLDGAAQTWMRENAGRFGFVEDVPREPWHWTYRPTH